MAKSILRSLFITILVAPAAFADDILSGFDQQGDLSSPTPNSEDSYFATLAPMASEKRSYIGVNIGAGTTSLKPNVSDGAQTQTLSATNLGYAGGIYGGLGTNFRNFYIGTELSGGYNTLKRDMPTASNVTISITKPLVIGLDLMPGYLSQQRNFLIYGRLGIGANLFQFKLKEFSDSSTKKIAIGLRAGVGMEYFMSEIVSMRIEYLLSCYGNIPKNYTDTNGTTYTYTFSSLKTNQANIGLTFNF